MTCEEFLALWDRGDRSPEVAAHVASCPGCRALLAIDGRVRDWQPALPASSEAEFLAKLRSKIESRPAPRLRGPRPVASGPAHWLRFAAAAVLLAAMGAAFLLGRASRAPETKEAAPVAGLGDAPKKDVEPPPDPDGSSPDPEVPPDPVPDKPKSDFRDRLMAAASGAGREAFLAQVKRGVDRARWFAAFRSPDAKERGAAVTIASIVKDAAMAPQLAVAAAKGDENAITVLGELGGIESVVVLASLAGMPGKREAVVEALAATGRPEAGDALAAIGAWKSEAAWRRLGQAGGPAIVARLRLGGDAALAAVDAASWSRSARAVPELAKLLGKAGTREPAAKALAAIGGKQAFAALAEAADEDDEVILAALKTMSGRDAVEDRLLDVRLKSPDRVRAARVLMKMGGQESVPALIRALESPDLRDVASEALGALRDESAVPALVGLLSERRHRPSAAAALGRIGSPTAVAALTAASRERSFYEEATRAIAAIAAPESVPHLIAALGERSVAPAAIAALEKIRDARAVLPLIGALGTENAAAAHRALMVITGEKLPGRQGDWVKWWKAKHKDGKNSLVTCY
ncbi:MAG: hypothetical protein FD180_213 [Planctomycetota bacterium]|nr:MAG: hypothetical protein FD180_213 [Planctomycetota bacterium]